MSSRYDPVFGTSLATHAIFVVWGPPSHGPRSRLLAQELGIRRLYFIAATRRRGWLAAPMKYGYQAAKTLRILLRERPRLVFVQSPPSFAVLFVWLACRIIGARFVVDAHSDALQRRIWLWPRWLYRMLTRQALATIVTNERFKDRIEADGGRAFVLRDIPARLEGAAGYPVQGAFNLVFVSTCARDEPLAEVVAALRELPEIDLYVTGRKPAPAALAALDPPVNVHFTDFLRDDEYRGLLSAADAVMCLTTRDNTMQRGACEALALGKPIVTSDWPLLRDYFGSGAVYVTSSSADIRRGVQEMATRLALFQAEIQDLQLAHEREWRQKQAALADLVRPVLAPSRAIPFP